MISNAFLPVALGFSLMVSYVSPRLDPVEVTYHHTNLSNGRIGMSDDTNFMEYTEKEISLGYRVQLNFSSKSKDIATYKVTTKKGYLDNQYFQKQVEKPITEPIDYTLGYQYVLDEWAVSFYDKSGECLSTRNLITYDTGYGEYVFL